MADNSKALWAERTAPATYEGRNGRGATVLVGLDETAAVFSPGELLQLALGACASLSADRVLSRALGKDFQATFGISAVKDDQNNRYSELAVELLTSLSALDPEERSAVIERAGRAIDKHCTVGRTLAAGATYAAAVCDEEIADA